MTKKDYNKTAKLKFLLYPLYLLIISTTVLLFIDDLVGIDYRASILDKNLLIVISLSSVVFLDASIICNIVLYKRRKLVNKKFIKENRRSAIMAAGVATGIVVANIFYTSLPTITNYSEGSHNALKQDMTGVKEDIDYLIGSSQYSLMENFLDKNVEINNSVISLPNSPDIQKLITRVTAHQKSPLFSRIPTDELVIDSYQQSVETAPSSCSPEQSSFGCGSAGVAEPVPVKSKLPTSLSALDPKIILGYSKILNDKLDGYNDFSFSAKISGETGECFLLSHKAERSMPVYEIESSVVHLVPMISNAKAETFCIDNESKKKFPNRIFFKESFLENVSSIEFWLIPLGNNRINILESADFRISDQQVIVTKQQESLKLEPTFFCLQGFNKGTPDDHFHMTKNDSNMLKNYCKTEN